MNQMFLGFIVIVFLVAMASSHKRSQKRYNLLCKEAQLVVEEKVGALHYISHYLSWILLVAIGAYILIGSVLGEINDYILLGGIVLYLMNYYLLEYMPHTDWCVLPGGLLSKRQLTAMNWENIVAYRWVVRDEKLILKVDYKGKGIVIRKGELLVPAEAKDFLVEQLRMHLPYIESFLEI